jgi:glycosyltransferase involved in cell wall biosynthesis
MKEQFHPKVSIVIPVYNGSNYLREAIDSALAQTYDNFEVIVVNDGSTDNGKTEKICKLYGDKIRYIKKENGGVASALNRGIKEMKGEYFSWLSHDDLYYPDKIERQIKTLSKLKDKKTILYSDYVVVDENLKELYREELYKMFSINNLNKPLFSLLMGYINSLSLLIHKENFLKYGLFDPKLRTTQDYSLWFKMFRNCKIKYQKGAGTISRTHEFQDSHRLKEIHDIEKKVLWDRMFFSLSKKEKINLSGSIINFYLHFYKHFKKVNINKDLQTKLYRHFLLECVKNYRGESKEISKKDALNYLANELGTENKNALKDFLLKMQPKKNKKRVVFWSDNWKYKGGINRVLKAIATETASSFDSNIFCWENSETKKGFSIPKNVGFIEIDKNLIDISELSKLMFLADVDLFICSQNFDIRYLKIYKSFKDYNIKTIAWDHSDYFLCYTYKRLLPTAKVKNDYLKNTNLIVCVNSLSTKIFTCLGLQALMIKNPVIIDSKKKVSKQKPNDTIISVGRFDDYQKRLDLILKVFAKVKDNKPTAKLYIVGSYDLSLPIRKGSKMSYKEYIKQLKIPKNSIVFTGSIANVEKYYNKASVNLMTSEREGFGLVAIEAAVFGLPSIVFEGSCSKDIIINNKNGYIVENGNTELMAKKIINLLDDPKLFTQFSKNSIVKSKEYRRDLIGKKWGTLLHLLLDTKNPDKIKAFINKENEILKTKDYECEIINMYEITLKFLSDNLNDEIETYKENISILEKKVFDYKNSTSWKITKPLRFVSRIFKKLKKKVFKKFI